tara:strand:+ start:95 stop:520 length:426 start_codon:yes stop_codon:yes gene_type:complete
MPGQIKSSKPTLSGISSTTPSKNALSVNREGVLMERGGPIYMTHSIMTSTSTTLTEGDRLTGVTVSSTKNEECCEGVALITNVTLSTTSEPTITDIAVTDVKEDIILPILYTDSYDNLMPIVRSTTAEDVYGGQPLQRRTN